MKKFPQRNLNISSSSISNLTFNFYRGGTATLHSTENSNAYANGTWSSGSTNSGNVLSGVSAELSGSAGNVKWYLKGVSLLVSGKSQDETGVYYYGNVTSGTYSLYNVITGTTTYSLTGNFKLYLKK